MDVYECLQQPGFEAEAVEDVMAGGDSHCLWLVDSIIADGALKVFSVQGLCLLLAQERGKGLWA